MKLKYIVFMGSIVISMQSKGYVGVEVGPVGVGIGSRGVGVAVDDPACVRCNYESCPDYCYTNDGGAFLGVGTGRRYHEYDNDRHYRSEHERR